jgi:hypothetical protein
MAATGLEPSSNLSQSQFWTPIWSAPLTVDSMQVGN